MYVCRTMYVDYVCRTMYVDCVCMYVPLSLVLEVPPSTTKRYPPCRRPLCPAALPRRAARESEGRHLHERGRVLPHRMQVQCTPYSTLHTNRTSSPHAGSYSVHHSLTVLYSLHCTHCTVYTIHSPHAASTKRPAGTLIIPPSAPPASAWQPT
jgi:hypothetical protein